MIFQVSSVCNSTFISFAYYHHTTIGETLNPISSSNLKIIPLVYITNCRVLSYDLMVAI